MQFNVNIYALVRVKITGVDAASPEDAVRLANTVNLGPILENHHLPIDTNLPGDMRVEYVVDAEDALQGAVVDPILPDGEVDYENTVDFDQLGIAALVKVEAQAPASQPSRA
ncbi:MAG: hypothetical protein ACREPQ_14210 [Rhodanobacter sp.]